MNDVDIEAGLTSLLIGYRDYRQTIIDECRKHRYIVFYGCGTIFHGIIGRWQKHIGLPISFVCDGSPEKWGRTYAGVRCITPSELLAIRDESAIFLTVGDFKAVYDDLTAKGFKSVTQLYKYDLDAADFIPLEDCKEVAKKLYETWGLLCDRKSRMVFCAIINRVLGLESCVNEMSEVYEGDQYFPADIISLNSNEVLVDVGAYTGDTLLDFIRRTNGLFDAAICLELNSINFKELQSTVDMLGPNEKIVIHNVGAWDKYTEVRYSLSNMDSALGCGDGRGYVERLDTIVANRQPTMIKMDIEGAEPNALQGAIKTIRQLKPRLAISIYHDFRHLWQIPILIKSFVPEYKIFLRHHTSVEYETVCYAVASEGSQHA